MEKLLINTPQNVRIEYNLASVGNRLLALAIDYGIMVCYVLLAVYLVTHFMKGAGDRWFVMGVYSFLLLPVFLYHFLFESLMNGQTLGKYLIKIKVVKLDGSRASIYEYFIRWTLNVVDIWMMSGVVGLLSIILTKQAQRIGDMAAGTTVINLNSKLKLQETVYEKLADTYNPVFPEYAINKLSDSDINIIKKSFQDGLKNGGSVILDKLARKITEVTGIKKEQRDSGSFIQIILRDHYFYNSEE